MSWAPQSLKKAFGSLQSSQLQRRSLSSLSPGRSWGRGRLSLITYLGKVGSWQSASWGLGSPSLCQRLPSTWGAAAAPAGLQPVPLSTLAAHFRTGTRNPLHPEQPPPGPCLGPLSQSPGSSGLQSRRVSYLEVPLSSRAQPYLPVLVSGHSTPRVGTAPLAMPSSCSPCPHP